MKCCRQNFGIFMAVAIQWYTFPVARNSQYFHQKHTYNSRPRGRIGAANGALWEFRTHLTARWAPASCCYLFAHYITLLPSRVSPANLHYKCRWCYHRFAYTLWRRWRIISACCPSCPRGRWMYAKSVTLWRSVSARLSPQPVRCLFALDNWLRTVRVTGDWVR